MADSILNNCGLKRQEKLAQQLGDEGYVQELYNFLQGKSHPEDIDDNNKPNLTKEQAWHVIYCLQEHFGMLGDKFELCCHCGCIFDSENGGTTIDEDSEFDSSKYGIYCEDCRPD